MHRDISSGEKVLDPDKEIGLMLSETFTDCYFPITKGLYFVSADTASY